MRISVLGCGRLGAVDAATMASLGHDVIGIDLDGARVRQLSAAEPPFYEPGLAELLSQGAASGRLRFSTDLDHVCGADMHMIAVGTPQSPTSDGADLTYLHAIVDGLLPRLRPGTIIVGRSTVPAGTAGRVADVVGDAATVLWNPAFTRRGKAVHDSLHPDRIVVGADPADERAVQTLLEVYRLDRERPPVFVTDLVTAELSKLAVNSFLATKLSFINAVSEVADAVGADIVRLADAIGVDPRIGADFLRAGLGYGGGGLPKDVRAFRYQMEESGVSTGSALLGAVDAINGRARTRTARLVHDILGGAVRGKRVAVLGATSAPLSDDVRDSPAVALAHDLADHGAQVVVTDPAAVAQVARMQGALHTTTSTGAALAGAHVVVVATEWDRYRNLDPHAVGAVVADRRIVDARNCLVPRSWRDAGWDYRSLGRT